MSKAQQGFEHEMFENSGAASDDIKPLIERGKAARNKLQFAHQADRSSVEKLTDKTSHALTYVDNSLRKMMGKSTLVIPDSIAPTSAVQKLDKDGAAPDQAPGLSAPETEGSFHVKRADNKKILFYLLGGAVLAVGLYFLNEMGEEQGDFDAAPSPSLNQDGAAMPEEAGGAVQPEGNPGAALQQKKVLKNQSRKPKATQKKKKNPSSVKKPSIQKP
jgi:hypothetical protein